MTDTAQQQIDLFIKIYDATMNKKLEWRLMNDSIPTVSLGSSSVVLDSFEYGGDPYEVVKVLDREGVTVESFNDGHLAGHGPPTTEYDNMYGMMRALRELAIRQANRVDETLQDVMDALNKLDE